MGKSILVTVGPLALALVASGCMGFRADEAQVGRAILMPQATLGGDPAAAPTTLAESCDAGGWRPRLLDRRDGLLARSALPAGHRVLRPGDMMSAEVDPQRMTITVNGKGKIDSVYCG